MKIKLNTVILGTTILCVYVMNYYKKKEIEKKKNRIEVLSDHFQLLNHWLEIKNEGKSVETYFDRKGYGHIAVYGMAELANRLSEELSGSSVSIDYGIDRDVCCSIARIDKVYYPEDNLPETDAIIVTPYSSFESIRNILKEKVNCPIISLEEIIWSI